MSERPTSIAQVLWSVFEEEGYKTIGQMARAKGVSYQLLWRWMSASDKHRRRASTAKSLIAVSQITGWTIAELSKIAAQDTEPIRAGVNAVVQRTRGRPMMARTAERRMDSAVLVVHALAQRFGGIDATECELQLPAGTLLGLFGLRLQHMTITGLRALAQDLGIPLIELMQHVEQHSDSE